MFRLQRHLCISDIIICATSAFSKATARLYADRQAELFLIGRNEERLGELLTDLKVRGTNLIGHQVLDEPDRRSILPLSNKRMIF